MEIVDLSARELLAKLETRELGAVEAAQAYLARIRELEDRVGAYLALAPELALAAAKDADLARSRGDRRPLLGLPVGVKDILLTQGLETTAGSKILKGYVPTYDATVVKKLKDAGAVILGKLNLDEFAMGSTTENSAFKVTHNPWDLDRVPGGSSGGSAAAVAARECAAAIGTDTGGSIRQPAACCGVAGIKPTYGRVSRYGVVAFASSLDQVGPIGQTVGDCALLLNVIAGHDPNDSTSVDLPVPDYTAALGRDLKGLRVGVPREYFAAGLDPQVEAAVRAALKTLEGLGAAVLETSLPHTEYSVATYYIIAPAEASSNLARYDGVRYGLRAGAEDGLIGMYKQSRDQGFGPEVKRRVLIGTYTLSAGYYDAYYKKAGQVRTLIKQDFDRAFETFDLLVAPTMPTPPFKIGEKTDDPLALYLSDVLTLACNLAGIPGMSVPCGFTHTGLPIGLQLFARHFDETTIFRAASAYEAATDWNNRRPNL